MTIKELESRTGMTRANIRFYEGEGLLTPKRLDNGYRDYSEDDAQTLEKIKLLRQLQLDLDTIRKVQRGQLTLEQALFSQLTRLEGDKAALGRAAEVCLALEQSGVEYGALNPQPWLRQLEALPVSKREALPPPPVILPERNDAPRACRHPWQRYFARMLDINLYDTIFTVLWLVLLRNQAILDTGILGWVLHLLVLMFTLAVEPVWLHCWGWTPGKWVFGLKLRDEHGQKLTLSQGFQRGCNVFFAGYGLNLPILNLYLYWRCRKLGLEGRDCFWDGENGYRYTKEERWFHGLIFVGVFVLCIAAVITGVKYTQTPLHQGGLTVEQFSENYNYYFKQLVKQDFTGQPSLGGDGRWVEKYLPDDGIYLFGATTVWSDPVFTLDGERVVAVELHMESEDSIVGVLDGGIREQLTLLAMTGSLDGLNLFNYGINGWVMAYETQASQWQDTEFTYRGLRVSRQVEYSGYSNTGNRLWRQDDNTPCHCEMTLTISLAE